MSTSHDNMRRQLGKSAGTFAAATAGSGIKGSIKVYDFRALYAAWPAARLPEQFSRPTKTIEVNHIGRYERG